jgi:hypothetical protein
MRDALGVLLWAVLMLVSGFVAKPALEQRCPPMCPAGEP